MYSLLQFPEAYFAVLRHYGVNNAFKFAFHDCREVKTADVVTVISYPILRKIIGSDPFTAVAGTDLRKFICSMFGGFFGLFGFQQPGIEDTQRDLFVAVLAFFLLTCH